MNIKLLSAALLLAFALSSCNTLSNRRDLFGPSQASGEYTNRYNEAMGKPMKSKRVKFSPRTVHGVPN